MITVYALVDPNTDQLRYIGQTNRPVNRRLSQHISVAKRKTVPPVNAWLRGLINGGLRPVVWVMEQYNSASDANEGEEFWIGLLRSWELPLLNLCPGGSVRRGWNHSEEAKAKFRAIRSNLMPSWCHTPEVRAKMGASQKKRWVNGGGPNAGRTHSAETRKKMAEARAKNPPKLSEEGRAKISESSRRRWQDPEWVAKFSAMMSGENNPNSAARRNA